MKQKNIKPLIVSALTAAAMLCVSVGGTFALFTDKAETAVSVESGKIDLKSSLTIEEVKSLNASSVDTHTLITDEAKKNASFENGGSVQIGNDPVTSAEIVTIKQLTPGDSVKFLATPNNSETNIKTLIRLKATMNGELAPSLVVKGFAGSATNPSFAMHGARTAVTPWVATNAGANPSSFYIEVSFPNHGMEITSKEQGIDNQYQGKTATVTLSYEAVQANAQLDDVLERANSLLATHETLSGEHYKTMFDALNGIKVNFNETELTRLSQFVWGADEDQFFEDAPEIRNHRYFKQATALDNSGYSIYAKSGWTANSIILNGIGFDAGEVNGITGIEYRNNSVAKDVIIRTNSVGTNLTINDATEGTIYHYGPAGNLNIIQCNSNSYHENGKVVFAEIAKGRIVLEPESDIDHIHINKKSDAEEFDEIIIKDNGTENLPSAITRDQVAVESEKELVVKVVTADNVVEPVYVYPYVDSQATSTGTTEKTEVQNTSVNSLLGQLVLDDGNNAGEKAMSQNEKQDIVEIVVEKAITEEVKDISVDYVARIGTNGYETLQGAVDAAKNNDKIVLLKDIELTDSVVIPGGKTVTINADDHNISNSVNNVIINYGHTTLNLGNGSIYGNALAHVIRNDNSLEIADNAVIYICSNQFGPTDPIDQAGLAYLQGQGAVLVDSIDDTYYDLGFIYFPEEIRGDTNYGCNQYVKLSDVTVYGAEMVINGGTIYSTADNSRSTIYNTGTITLNNGAYHGAPKAEGGFPSYAINNYGIMTMNNCVVTSVHGSIATSGNTARSTLNNVSATLSPTGAATGITSHVIYTYNNAMVEVNGGTYRNNASDASSTGGDVVCNNNSQKAATITINGGTFIGAITLSEYSNGDIIVKGGTFNQDPKNYVASGYVSLKNDTDNTWTVIGNSTHVVSVLPNIDGTTATVTYAYDADPSHTKTEQVRYLRVTNLGSQTSNTTFDVYCGDALIASGATMSSIFNTSSGNSDVSLGRNAIAFPEGNIYFSGDAYIYSDALFMIGAKDSEGNPLTRILPTGTGAVSKKGLQIQNRTGSNAIGTYYFENLAFDGSAQPNIWGHLLTMTSYSIDAEFNNVSFENMTQASKSAAIGVWANQKIWNLETFPTAAQNLGVDIRLTNVNMKNMDGKAMFQFQGFTSDDIAAETDCFSYISVVFDEASASNCGLNQNSAYCTQAGNNLYDYGIHYLWKVNGVEIKSVNGTSVNVY